MNINEIKELFNGKFNFGDSISKKVSILDNKIFEIEKNLLQNSKLKDLLIELYIIKAII